MKVIVWKAKNGVREVDILPSIRSQRKPAVLRQVAREDLVRKVREVVEGLGGKVQPAGEL